MWPESGRRQRWDWAALGSFASLRMTLFLLTAGAVVADVLLERVELLADFVNARLEQVANGDEAEQLAGFINDGQMAEVRVDHCTHSFAGGGFGGGGFDRAGHDLAD